MFLFSDLTVTLWIAVLKEQLVTSRHLAEGARSQEGPSGEDRRRGVASRAQWGLVLTVDSAAIAAIVKTRGSLHGCS
jgi:hypothetical protein